jgi:hypothetical protein
MQRPGAEMASFAAIAGAETAPTREFSRHVFDITALLRVSITLYNYKMRVGGRTRARTWDPMMLLLLELGQQTRSSSSTNFKPTLRRNEREQTRLNVALFVNIFGVFRWNIAAHNGLTTGSSPAAPTDAASNQPSFFVMRRGISAIANAARAPIDAPPRPSTCPSDQIAAKNSRY